MVWLEIRVLVHMRAYTATIKFVCLLRFYVCVVIICTLLDPLMRKSVVFNSWTRLMQCWLPSFVRSNSQCLTAIQSYKCHVRRRLCLAVLLGYCVIWSVCSCNRTVKKCVGFNVLMFSYMLFVTATPWFGGVTNHLLLSCIRKRMKKSKESQKHLTRYK